MNANMYMICVLTLLSFSIHAQKKNLIKVLVEKEVSCVDKHYAMVFHDEFEGNSLDTAKWFTFYPYGPKSQLDSCSFCRSHVSNNVYLDENCEVHDGKLYLKADKVDAEWFGKKYNHTSAMVHSRQTFNTYSKYEIKCQLPKGSQQWPSFWIFGWNTEIDVFEFICKGTRKPEFSIHNWLKPYCADQKRIERGSPCYSNVSGVIDFGIDFSSDFHTFTVEYEPTIIKFYIDDIMIRYVPKFYDLQRRPITSCKIKPGEYFMDAAFPNYGEPVQVIAAQSICWKHKEKKPIFPNFMVVDYIRVYQKEIQQGLSITD